MPLRPEPAIIIHDAAGSIVGWNHAAEWMFGYGAHEVLGRPFAMIVPDDGDPSEPLATRVCRTREGRAVRALCRRTAVTDGADRALATCEVITLLDELPVPRLATTTPWSLQDDLRRERERLQSVVESAPCVVHSFRISPNGKSSFPFVSAQATSIFGFTPEQIQADARIVLSRIPREDRVVGDAGHALSARSSEPWNAVFRYEHPDGELKWLEARSRPRRELDGSTIWNGVVVDITSRKVTDEKVAVLQAQLESALVTTGLGAWIQDLDANLVWANETMRAMWEVPDDAPEWYDITVARARAHPEDEHRVLTEFQRMVDGGGLLETEFRVLRTDGTHRWVTSRSRLERGVGRSGRIVGVQLDVTSHKEAAESALRSSKLEALGTLAAGIAHDFNNVLFAISGNAALALALAKLPERSAARTFVAEIDSATARATELVRQILVYSRPDEQRRTVLCIAEVVQQAVSLLRASMPAMIVIATSFEPDTPEILADASHVHQIVINLGTNAVQAIGKGRSGRIEVALRGRTIDETATKPLSMPAGRYAVLSVRDDGTGMDEATKARIFDPFFTTRRAGEGSGLGLSVVHGLVRALDGHVVVSTRPGFGSTFELYFPAAPEVEDRVPKSTSESTAEGQQILFVDDESMLVQLAESMLEVLGYLPRAFQAPEQALAAFRERPQAFAAVITDLSMPTMSGFDVAREVLAIRPDIPVLMMSGYIGIEERTMAAELGVRELVLKPVTMDRLRQLMIELCPGLARPDDPTYL